MSKNNKKGEMNNDKNSTCRRNKGIATVEGVVRILDSEYGEDRDVNEGDGGYVLIIESADELIQLKDIYIDIDEVIPEFADVIKVKDGEDYTSTLILLNNDFRISLIMPMSLTPNRVL